LSVDCKIEEIAILNSGPGDGAGVSLEDIAPENVIGAYDPSVPLDDVGIVS
jgi:hypothetical protein